MIENELTESLRAFIEQSVADYRLPVKNGEPRAPRVFNGYLPPKRSGYDDDFPFVVVRPDSGEVDTEQTTVSVSIVIGCYTEEFDGHEHCLNVMSRIRNALTMMENNTLANRYVLSYPISWSVLEDQPYPQWQLDMETKWTMKTPQCIF